MQHKSISFLENYLQLFWINRENFQIHGYPTVQSDDGDRDYSKWEIDPKRAEESRIMAERARANHSFVYIKIPQVPLTVSYQTGKVNRKHIKFDIPNIENFRLDIPLLEYKSELLTWQDQFRNYPI